MSLGKNGASSKSCISTVMDVFYALFTGKWEHRLWWNFFALFYIIYINYIYASMREEVVGYFELLCLFFKWNKGGHLKSGVYSAVMLATCFVCFPRKKDLEHLFFDETIFLSSIHMREEVIAYFKTVICLFWIGIMVADQKPSLMQLY